MSVVSRMQQWVKHDAFWLVVLLITITIIALPTLTYPLGRDQGEFATLGRGILNGLVPYTDLWNPKPPAVFYIYALMMRLFGQSTEALRAIDLLIVPPIGLCLYWLGKQFTNRRVGLWAALLFPVFYFTETFWTLTQNDGIVLLPMVLAAVGVVKVTSHQSPVTSHQSSVISQRTQPTTRNLAVSFLTGMLCGYVVWFKYPFVTFGLAMVIGYLGICVGTRRALSLQKADVLVALSFMTGGLLALLGGALYMMSIGAWDELVTSARVTSQYTLLTFNWSDFRELLGTALVYRWQQWGLLGVLAALSVVSRQSPVPRGGLAVASQTPKVESLESSVEHEKDSSLVTRHSSLFIFIWLLAGLAIMLVQAKGYDYHWLPMLPSLVLLGAMGLDRVMLSLLRIVGTGRALSLQMLVALILLGIMVNGIWPRAWNYLTGQEDKIAYYGRFVAGAADEFNAADSLNVANLLRERVVPGDSLYIWGFRPEVYYLSGLNPGSRFFFHFPLVAEWYPPEWREQNVETLWASLPPYVLVLQVDYMPWVIGNDKDSNTLLQEYTELNNWLIFNYERDTQIGNFFVWRRKS